MSTLPIPYDRQSTFSTFSTEQFPTVGQELEAEFNKIDQSVDATQARLAEIQRDDGLLKNLSVHPEALSASVRALLAITGGQIEGAWAMGVSYDKGDVVESPNGVTYIAAVAHIADADFSVDLDAGRWLAVSGDAAATTYASTDAGAIHRTVQGKLHELISVLDFIPETEHAAIRSGTSVYDCAPGIQACVNAGIAFMPPGVYPVASAIVIPDGGGLVGASAFWKRRTSYVYSGAKQSVLKYIGPSGTNTCVIRASATAVGIVGSSFGGADTDDLTNIVMRDFHVDANGLADFGVYIYRAGNQATIGNLTVEKAKKFNHVHLGCYAAKFGVFGAYQCEEHGVSIGWDIFGWNSVEATNFAYSATFHTCNNGTAGTYVAGTGTDLDGSGGKFSVGRGSRVVICSESNDGRACILSQYNIASAAGGPTDYVLEYMEANADGPYVDYRDGMDMLRLRNGFLHPGNGVTLLPQNITIDGKNNSGVVTADSGPTERAQWLVIEGLTGDLSGVGVAINSNTYKMILRDCARNFTFPNKFPQTDDYIPSENQVGAGVYFSALASPTIYKATNGTLARSGTGTYIFTFTRPFKTGTIPVAALSIVISATLDTRVRITTISATSVAIRTYDAAGNAADTGDRVTCLLSGILAYQ